jgi:two-component system cell cycle sensor histidine kinase/response regulator CckA
MVVDDSAEVRRLLEYALSRSGYHVIRAATPAIALEAAATAPALDLIVTDVEMPGRSGPELVAALRRQRPELPALYVSGSVAEDFDVASDSRARFLPKPFSMRALERAVRESLAERAEGAGDGG